MGVKHTLLETPPDRVPHEFAQTVIDFCKPIDSIVAAYVGLTSVAEDFQLPVEQLAAAFELASDDEAAMQAVADRFYESIPEEVQAGGCNVLAPAALAIWREKAQRVYSRT
jgi:cobalamin-dependent methionine synthase I